MVAIAIVMVVSCGCLDKIKTYGRCMVGAPSLAPGGARQKMLKRHRFFCAACDISIINPTVEPLQPRLWGTEKTCSLLFYLLSLGDMFDIKPEDPNHLQIII
jgi:hypothetical protein